jgi:hypothetical protein
LLVFVLLCVGSIPVVLAFGSRPLAVAAEPIVVDQALVEPTVIDSPTVASTEPAMTASSSVLDQSSTQVILLPVNQESAHE